MTHNLELGPERLALDFLLDDTQRIPKIHNSLSGSETPPAYASRKADSPLHQHRRESIASIATSYSSALGSDLLAHSAPIRNCPATCPLDAILLDFLHERQTESLDGLPSDKLVGPAYPSVSSLLNPSHAHAAHPLSKVFTDILKHFPDLSALPEKVAVLYIMFLLMRWQIAPTPANYDRLPDWITPRPSQLFSPHPVWIDHLPFPKMRDVLVREYNPQTYIFDNFFVPFTATLSLNWKYEDTDVLLWSEGEGEGEAVINPVFERHLRRLENWSLGGRFRDAFPGLEGTFACRGR